MKVCGNCGEEFDGRDGDNQCRVCEDATGETRRRRRIRRTYLDVARRSLGLAKVRGVLGGTFWE